MIRNAFYIGFISIIIAVIGVMTLKQKFPVGPIVLGMTLIPLSGLFLAKRSFKSAVPDLVFGALDTGLLTIPALWGGILFGVAGAIAGGVIGDALSDGIAGFVEGGIAKWLREKGIEESREPITTSLGKMAGCLGGSGLVLSLALVFGISLKFT